VTALEMRMETNLVSGTGHLGPQLHALLDRELSPADESQARKHLDACPKCAAEHEKLSGAVAALQGLGRARAPEGFAGRVLKRMRGQRRGAPLRALSDNKLQFEGVIVVLIAAAAAAAILAYEVKTNWGLFAKNEGPQKARVTAPK
jgi:anti-sigma factor RsiW